MGFYGLFHYNLLSLQKNSGGDASLLRVFYYLEENKTKDMIDKTALTQFIEQQLEETDLYLVDIAVTPDNVITVEIDSDSPVDIDECIALSRKIEEAFDREEEDYELEVGSAGITSPFKVVRQYQKNIGNEVEVIARDGRKYTGVLREAGPDSFTIISEEKVKREGAKRPVVEEVTRTFPYSDVKSTSYLLQF